MDWRRMVGCGLSIQARVTNWTGLNKSVRLDVDLVIYLFLPNVVRVTGKG